MKEATEVLNFIQAVYAMGVVLGGFAIWLAKLSWKQAQQGQTIELQAIEISDLKREMAEHRTNNEVSKQVVRQVLEVVKEIKEDLKDLRK